MRLKNGTIIPHGLLAIDNASQKAGFEKSYNNVTLKTGVVIRSMDVESELNITKMGPEYDVIVIEQDKKRAVTPITYKNCLAINGLGGIGDFFEKRYRTQSKAEKFKGRSPKDQDGAIVLLLCLDGNSDKAFIVGALQHPKRKTKLKGKGMILAGEFNGLGISVADDGSANLTFKGATDNEGKPKDAAAGDTTVDIEKDGTVQFKNKGVTYRMEKAGKVLLNAKDSLTVVAAKDISLTTEANLKVTAKEDVSAEMVKLALKASGSSTFEVGSFELKSEGKAELKAQMVDIEAQSMCKVKATQITLDGLVFLGGAGGTPALTLQTQFLGIGNLGAPVISQAIGPFSTKVFLI